MDEFRAKANRILRVALALSGVGGLVFFLRNGWQSALVFLIAATVSLASLYLLARGIEVLSASGGTNKGWLKPLGFIVRFLLYAVALSAIIEVYPGHNLELFFGVFLAILAILIEALIEAYNART